MINIFCIFLVLCYRETMKEIGVRIKHTTVSQPQQGGRFEERHRVFKERLSAILSGKKAVNIDKAIEQAVWILK